ncbi:hypothetical protein DY000_02054091 [Brassica cretica]|uniref:Uncharacterized protein n=1 Tax=Brassica cretica TaxID=69181 RepID=A0ABQ7AAT2_BRACR|nr:hypothetical protein DY000_02054091 [Brassica cretica]
MIFNQIMNLCVIQKNESRWLIFRRLIMGLLQKQHHVTPRSGDKVERAITYKKDKRVGEIYEQRKAKGKNTAKDEPKGRTSARPPRHYLQLQQHLPRATELAHVG